MITERIKVSAESYWIRSRGWLRTLFQTVGVGLVLIGAANMLFGVGLLTAYRELLPMAATVGTAGDVSAVAIADVVLMAVGAIITWLA